MADGQPITAEALATRSGCHPRLVREWLDAKAASGYVESVDGGVPAAAGAGDGARQRGLAGVRGAGTERHGVMLHRPRQDSRRLPRQWSVFLGRPPSPACSAASSSSSARATSANLTTTWLPALEGVVAKLRRGAKVADVGCGHGASTIVMAQAYPNSRFVGFDFHGPSIEMATQRASDAGVGERVTFSTATAQTYPERDFDLICFFDCLHDMGDPVGAARHARQALKDDGDACSSWSRSRETRWPRTRRRSGVSTTPRPPWSARRTPCPRRSVSALGAQAGEVRLAQVFKEAGFRRFRRATETPFNLVLEARK